MSEITRDAIRDYLYRAEMEQARKTFSARVQKLGIKSEEDLRKIVLDK